MIATTTEKQIRLDMLDLVQFFAEALDRDGFAKDHTAIEKAWVQAARAGKLNMFMDAWEEVENFRQLRAASIIGSLDD